MWILAFSVNQDNLDLDDREHKFERVQSIKKKPFVLAAALISIGF